VILHHPTSILLRSRYERCRHFVIFSDDNDAADEFGFWKDAPGRIRPRRATARTVGPRLGQIVRRPSAPTGPAGTRHHDTGEVVIVDERPRAAAPIDPLLRRVGTLALIVALAIPAALILRPGSNETGASLSPDQALAAASDDPTPAASDPGSSADATAAADSTTGASADATATVAVQTDTAADSTEAATANATGSIGSVNGGADASAQAETVTRAACGKTYAVVAGDYWILIAKKVSVSVDELLAANAANSSTPLFPGGTICLPANASAPTTVATTAPPTTAPPTTKPPTTTAPPATTAPPKTYTRAEVEAIIRAVWPDELENEAVRIATRESNLVPTAHNWCCHGLFQIYFNVHKTWLAQMGVTQVSQLYDPWTNALAAYVLYQRAGGFGPWQ